MSLSKLHAPLLTACALLSRPDHCVGSTIRIALNVADEPDALQRVEGLVAHLASEHGLVGRVEVGKRHVTVYLECGSGDSSLKQGSKDLKDRNEAPASRR